MGSRFFISLLSVVQFSGYIFTLANSRPVSFEDEEIVVKLV